MLGVFLLYSTQLAKEEESLTVHLFGTIHMLSQCWFHLLQSGLVSPPPQLIAGFKSLLF